MGTLRTKTGLPGELASGDEVAWRHFVADYRAWLADTALKAGARLDEVPDLIQESLQALAQSLGGFEYTGRGSFRAYLRKVVENKVRDWLRRQRAVKRPPEALREREAPGEESPLGRMASAHRAGDPANLWMDDLVEVLKARVMRRVSTLDYQAFALRFLQDWDGQAAADFLGIRRAALYKKAERVLAVFREEMGKLGLSGSDVLSFADS